MEDKEGQSGISHSSCSKLHLPCRSLVQFCTSDLRQVIESSVFVFVNDLYSCYIRTNKSRNVYDLIIEGFIGVVKNSLSWPESRGRVVKTDSLNHLDIKQ